MAVASTAAGRAQSVWGVSQATTFDPNKVYSKASDSHGHSKRVSANVMPDDHNALMRLVGDAAWPEYETLQDVVRDACHQLIHRRKDQMTLPEDREAAVDLLNVVAHEERLRHVNELAQRYEAVIHRMDQVMVNLMRVKAWDIMRATLDEEQDEVRTLPEPFRARALEGIKFWREKLPQ